jgi:large subunit ribosomal protein L21
MYAVIESGGKQYKVEPGQRIRVERLAVPVGETVELEPLLVRNEQGVVVGKELSGAKVQAKVVAHPRGPKVRILKFKPKTGYLRRQGHRQELTQLEIERITTAPGGSDGA